MDLLTLDSWGQWNTQVNVGLGVFTFTIFLKKNSPVKIYFARGYFKNISEKVSEKFQFLLK